MKVERAGQVAIGLLALPILYLASPLLVYATASMMGRNRGMDNQFADFLDAFYTVCQKYVRVSTETRIPAGKA